jgi:hypothetical protein
VFSLCGCPDYERRFQHRGLRAGLLFGFDQVEHKFGGALANGLAVLVDTR